MTDNRLKLYIISCHVDKPLKEGAPKSIYDCHIQAGAALTDQRTCPLNDMDDCPDNISDRNRRYGEGSAMFWIYRHLDTPYTGIMHYRRRFALNDEEYSGYMDKGVDIITSVPIQIVYSGNSRNNMTIEEHYRTTHYSYDWDLMLNLLKEANPDDYTLACECFSQRNFHPCNINVFRSEIYREFCDWAFPICDRFYKQRPEKFDIFQKRDIGYILERLSHLFITKKKSAGLNIVEAPIIELDSQKWDAHNEPGLDDASHVFDVCNELYQNNRISRISEVLEEALKGPAASDEKLRLLARMIIASQNERCEAPMTMFEYLQPEFRTDLNMLTQIWNGFEQAVKAYHDVGSEESLNKLTQYINLTGFSKPAMRTALAIADGVKLI